MGVQIANCNRIQERSVPSPQAYSHSEVPRTEKRALFVYSFWNDTPCEVHQGWLKNAFGVCVCACVGSGGWWSVLGGQVCVVKNQRWLNRSSLDGQPWEKRAPEPPTNNYVQLLHKHRQPERQYHAVYSRTAENLACRGNSLRCCL